MKRHFGLVAVLVLTFTGAVRGADAPDDAVLKALQGTWTVVSLERNGKAAAPERIEGRELVFEGRTFIDQQGDKILGEGSITLDPSKKPGTMDARFTEGPVKGQSSLAIYELNGDTLRTCSAAPGKERPTEFLTRPDSGAMMFVYQRAK